MHFFLTRCFLLKSDPMLMDFFSKIFCFFSFFSKLEFSKTKKCEWEATISSVENSVKFYVLLLWNLFSSSHLIFSVKTFVNSLLRWILIILMNPTGGQRAWSVCFLGFWLSRWSKQKTMVLLIDELTSVKCKIFYCCLEHHQYK